MNPEPDLSPFRDKPAVSAELLRSYEHEHSISPRMRAAGWEPRFTDSLELSMSRAQKLVLRDTGELLRNKGAIIALVGERGLGKTTIAARIAIERTEHFFNFYKTLPEDRVGLKSPSGIPVYRKMAALVARFKPVYSDFGSIETEKLMEAQQRLCNETLLVIDELHECDELKMKDRILTDLVDIRYARRRDTILISNQTEEEFRASTNASILSRLSEHGKIIVCKWKSFRDPKP